MNIPIPYYWLLDHLQTTATAEEIAKFLSLSGPSVERIEIIEDEPVFDIEVTTNRVDCMSVRGIAREAAAILPQHGIKATLKPFSEDTFASIINLPKTEKLDLEIINHPQLCHRILALKLGSLTISPSSPQIQKRLKQVGQRPLNNIIDITNLVMWEIGQPIHAFDYDRLTQKKVIIREAKPRETFVTLDHKSYSTKGGEVVFDDGTNTIIDLPGIMGTANTTITDKTKNVLLWIESVDAVKIRQTSMTHAIRTRAAVLNEKGVDPHLGKLAILIAAQLTQVEAHATITSQLYDNFPHPITPKAITLKQHDLDRYLGLTLPQNQVIDMLTTLECQVKITSKASLSVTPPTFRAQDLTLYQDLIEEVARVYGYHRLPSTIMATPIPIPQNNGLFKIENLIRLTLIGLGCQELYTYSMISQKLAKASGFPLKDHLKIKNPLTDDFEFLRRSLVPSLVEALQQNYQPNATIFELQHVFHPSSKSSQLPQESLELAVVTNHSFSHLAGMLSQLTQKLHLPSLTITPQKVSNHHLNPQYSGLMILDQKPVGVIGINQIPGFSSFVFQIDTLQPFINLYPQKINLYPYAPIIEDLTFTLPAKTHLGPVIETISSSSALIISVTIKSQFEANTTFTITYRDPKQSLKVASIAPIREKIVSKLTNTYQASLVGALNS